MKFEDLSFDFDIFPADYPIELCSKRATFQTDDGVTVSVISGFAAYSDENRPYEVWWWDTETGITPGCEPIGYLTENDVEMFVNEKFYMHPEQFVDKVKNK